MLISFTKLYWGVEGAHVIFFGALWNVLRVSTNICWLNYLLYHKWLLLIHTYSFNISLQKNNLFTAFRQKQRDPFLHLLKIIFMSKRHNLGWHILVSFNYVIGIVFNNDGPLRMMSLFIDHAVLYYFWISLI